MYFIMPNKCLRDLWLSIAVYSQLTIFWVCAVYIYIEQPFSYCFEHAYDMFLAYFIILFY